MTWDLPGPKPYRRRYGNRPRFEPAWRTRMIERRLAEAWYQTVTRMIKRNLIESLFVRDADTFQPQYGAPLHFDAPSYDAVRAGIAQTLERLAIPFVEVVPLSADDQASGVIRLFVGGLGSLITLQG